jgi:hypothetical protein
MPLIRLRAAYRGSGRMGTGCIGPGANGAGLPHSGAELIRRVSGPGKADTVSAPAGTQVALHISGRFDRVNVVW